MKINEKMLLTLLFISMVGICTGAFFEINMEENTKKLIAMREQLIANNWVEIYNISADESLYVYKGTEALPDGDIAGVVKKDANERKIDLFETFTVAEQADISKLGGAKVTITAFAIQGDLNNSIEKSGTLTEMQQLWNVVSGEFEFETVIIPDKDFGHVVPTQTQG